MLPSTTLQYAGITGLSVALLSLLFVLWRMQGNGDRHHMWYHEYGPYITALAGAITGGSASFAFQLSHFLGSLGLALGFILGCVAASYGYKRALPGGPRARQNRKHSD